MSPFAVSRPPGDAAIEPDAPALVENLIREAEAAGASDIHLQTTLKGLSVGFRLDGVLTPVREFERVAGERMLGRIKFLAQLRTYQGNLPQDGRIDRLDAGARTDVRVATYPTVTGEKIVLRLFRTEAVPTLDGLGFAPEVRGAIETFLAQPTGLLLLTGPAGSGKTTTIYACLQHLAARGNRHIITIEDPVEQVISGVMQTEIDEPRGLDYPTAARHLLRQDPQVLALGEIRDDATAAVTVRAALTGHLVLSTLHAGSCRGVLDRLMQLNPDASAIAAGISLIVNQRLLRCLCRQCQGTGCPHCLETGFRGRIPVVEWMVIDEAARQAIREGAVCRLEPAQSLASVAAELCRAGLTSVSECNRVIGIPHHEDG